MSKSNPRVFEIDFDIEELNMTEGSESRRKEGDFAVCDCGNVYVLDGAMSTRCPTCLGHVDAGDLPE